MKETKLGGFGELLPILFHLKTCFFFFFLIRGVFLSLKMGEVRILLNVKVERGGV